MFSRFNASLTAVIAICFVTTASAKQPLDFYGFEGSPISAEAQEGLDLILSGQCFPNAVPHAAVQKAESALRLQKGLGYDPLSEQGLFYAFGRVPSPPDRKAGAAEGITLEESVFAQGDQQVWSGNCFGCHAGVANGQVVAGMGNSHYNRQASRQRVTRGDNYGPYGVWRFIAKLEDPENKGLVHAKERTELEDLLDATTLAPVDPMPWWLMKYKTRDYWYADGAPDDAAHFAINFTLGHDKMNEARADHVQTVAKALAFARETTSPPFPGELDAELVQKGADLFHGRARPANRKGFRTCKTCHGTYTRKESAGDLSQPGGWAVKYPFSKVLRNVKTDDTYNKALQRFAPLIDHQNKLAAYYEKQGTPELTPKVRRITKPGYIAPPLVGVWASAPYFHNGSVPTVEMVLNSKLRPEIWVREHRDPHAYDLEMVGMKHRVLGREEFDQLSEEALASPLLSEASIDHNATYDTAATGHGNQGHTFGDNLTQEERRAIMEFLKSLSGPEM